MTGKEKSCPIDIEALFQAFLQSNRFFEIIGEAQGYFRISQSNADVRVLISQMSGTLYSEIVYEYLKKLFGKQKKIYSHQETSAYYGKVFCEQEFKIGRFGNSLIPGVTVPKTLIWSEVEGENVLQQVVHHSLSLHDGDIDRFVNSFQLQRSLRPDIFHTAQLRIAVPFDILADAQEVRPGLLAPLPFSSDRIRTFADDIYRIHEIEDGDTLHKLQLRARFVKQVGRKNKS